MNARSLFSIFVVSSLSLSAGREVSAQPQPTAPIPKVAVKNAREKSLAASGPEIHFSEIEYKFGTVKPGEIVRHDFKVANLGSVDLEITGVRPSCGCTTAGSWSRIVKPKETGVIPIQLDTGRFKGDLNKTIVVTCNDPKKKQVILKLSGTVWQPIRISSSYVVFSSVSDPNAANSKSIEIINQVEQPLKITDLKVHSDKFKAELKTIVEDKQYELLVTTVPPLDQGSNRGTITMKTSNPDMPTISLSAFASVLPAVQVIPAKIVLPSAKLDTPLKRYVTVLNRRAGEFAVSDLRTTFDGVDVVATEIQKGKRITISLVFPKGFEVPESGKLALSGKTNRPELPTFEVPISFVRR